MRRHLLILASFGLIAPSTFAEPVPLDARTQMGDPITFKNLTIFPLYALDPSLGKEVLTLDEGMDKSLVKITERDTSGTVNELVLHNRSDKPLFLMAGEVILGGKQDRVIGKDILIPPKKKVAIGVFCVEQGRWSANQSGGRFRSGKALAHSKLRTKANFKGQGQVWDEVAKKNQARGTVNATSTYRQVATERKVADAVAPYGEHFSAALARLDQSRMVGLAVALDGQIVGIERFGSPKLFAKMQGKLLRSIYVEAVDAPVAKEPPPTPTVEAVKGFAADLNEAPTKVVVDQGPARTEQRRGNGKAASKVVETAPGAPAARDVYESITNDANDDE